MIRVTIVVVLVILLPVCYGSFIEEMECGLREVALNYSQQLINRQFDRIYDALQLSNCSTSYSTRHKPVDHYARSHSKSVHFTSVNAINYYVDGTKGSDANNGQSVSAPFKTINKAQLVVSQQLSSMSAGSILAQTIIVNIRKGIYFETLQFDNKDSGLSIDTPVIYTAYNNENVILSGGNQQTVTFSQSSNNSHIYIAKLDLNQLNGITFDQLFINVTERLIRARSPNGNPEIDIQPQGYAQAVGEYQGQQTYNSQPFYINSTNVQRNSTYYPYFGADLDPRGGGQRYHVSGDAERFEDKKGFWEGSVPKGILYNASQVSIKNSNDINNNNIANPAIANVFQQSLWGNWVFEIESVNLTVNGIVFGKGGWQEGRGGGISNNLPFYIENSIEFLDSPNEWYFDNSNGLLYLYPNFTNFNVKNFNLSVYFPTNYQIITMTNYAKNIIIDDIVFTHTLRSQLLGYIVPSGGDWSIHRGGAIFLENSENIVLNNLTLLRTGGNGIFLSNSNENISITNCDFLYSGDSAIGIVGTSNLMDGYSSNSYSNNINIISNYVENVGVYGKQTSAIFTSVAGNININSNVFHSGPRAGININDGYYGAKIIENNLLFNWVRETQDHGPINTWDRVCYIFSNTGSDGGGDSMNMATTVPAWNVISHNFIYNGPSGNRGSGNLFPAVDNDDGSRMYFIENNVAIYGGMKNFLGTDKIWNNNLIIFPNHWPGGGPCVSAWAGLNHRFTKNSCIANFSAPLGYFACNTTNFTQSSKEMPFGESNFVYVPNGEFEFDCGDDVWNLTYLQSLGWELNTTVYSIPSAQTIVQMANDKIQEKNA